MNAATLEIPPLRDRKEDIPLLVEYFLEELSRARGKELRASGDVLNVLLSHHWPGNVRELKNTVSYAASLAGGDMIEAADLPPALLPTDAAGRPSRSPAASLADVRERLMIASTLRQCGNNKKRAAQALNISRNTLYNKLKKYGFTPVPESFPAPLLALQDVSLSYGSVNALRNVNLVVKPSEIHAIVGEQAPASPPLQR